MNDRVRRLRRLVDAARIVARDPVVVDLLVGSTGLSRENVLLGLSEHLETNATDAELAALVRATKPAAAVHVVLSPSVFVAPLRAIALGLAASDRVTVRPSRRETAFARTLVAVYDDPSVTLTDTRPEEVTEGEIHAYGRDETIAAIRKTASVPVRGHAAGIGVAVVCGDLANAAEAIARDVVPFDQRGCLSPRVVFVSRDVAGFARLLKGALDGWAERVPRSELDASERADLARWQATVTFAGALHRGASCAVGVPNVTRSLLVPPTGRHVVVLPLGAVPLAEVPHLVAVGTDDTGLRAPPYARVSPLGMMQRPPLDGPVDRRLDL